MGIHSMRFDGLTGGNSNERVAPQWKYVLLKTNQVDHDRGKDEAREKHYCLETSEMKIISILGFVFLVA